MTLTWIEDPFKYSYIRKSGYIHFGRRFPIKSWGKDISEFAKLIGFEQTGHPSPSIYYYDVYWLKKHDRDLSPDGVYKGKKEFGGFMPSEAVDPKNLVNKMDINGLQEFLNDLEDQIQEGETYLTMLKRIVDEAGRYRLIRDTDKTERNGEFIPFNKSEFNYKYQITDVHPSHQNKSLK